jgi:hypothetical protein
MRRAAGRRGGPRLAAAPRRVCVAASKREATEMQEVLPAPSSSDRAKSLVWPMAAACLFTAAAAL